MKNKKNPLSKLIVIVVLLSLGLGFFIAYSFLKPPNKNQIPYTIINSTDSSEKFISKETLVKDIKISQKLITTEIDLKDTEVIDDSWGNLDIFKKYQNIYFYGKGVYTLDLSVLKAENIIVNTENNTISLNSPRPTVDMIVIDENKTEYTSTETGLLRFGNIKLSPEDNQLLTTHVKSKMKTMMEESINYQVAEENTKTVLKNLVNSVLKSNNNLKIEINIGK
ncbi:MAG TPA: DUF4230 domain-containing protein [Clostridiaceae bacterium]